MKKTDTKAVTIKKAPLTDDTVNQLIELSGKWADEGCTNGLVKNTKEDIMEPVFAAFDGDKIVGYAFGHFYSPEKKTSYIEPGESCFFLDELYVLLEYRSAGIGKRLFDAVSGEAAEKAGFLTLATSTKDYKRILKFYTENAGMDFHDAFLIKKLK